MRGVNKVILVGTLGQDPEINYTQGGSSIANISMATSESWKDKNTGQMQEKTEWHRVVFFSRLAEIAGEYLKKGSKVYIEGSLQTRKWQDKQGQDRYTTEIKAREMQMLDSKGGNQGSQQQAPQQQNNRPQPRQQAPNQQAPQQMGNAYQQQSQGGYAQSQPANANVQQTAGSHSNQGTGGFEDDLPPF